MGEETPKLGPRSATVLGMLMALSDAGQRGAVAPDVSPLGYVCSVCRQESGHAPECQKPRGLIKIGTKT